MATWLRGLALLLFFLLPFAAHAASFYPTDATQDTTARYTLRDTTVALPEVTVTATRTAVSPAEAPARVTVLSSKAIEQSGAASVAELLSERAGLFVREYGSGGLATLSMRGAAASQTLVLLDGHRIADPQLGQLDFSLLPTLLLESAEVMHGAASPLYGSDGMGAAVNLQTLRPNRTNQFKLLGSAGAFGERSAGALAAERQGPLSGLALVEYRTAENDFPYVNESLFPPQEVRRRNADREQLSLYSTLGYEGQEHRLRASGWYSSTERGLPGPATTPPSGERQWDESLRLWADDEMQTGWGQLRLGGLFQHSRLRYLNPAQEIDQTGRTLIGSLEGEARLPAGQRWLLSGGMEGSYSQARHPSLSASAQEWHTGAFASGIGSYGALTWHPALRADAYLLPEGSARLALSPKLGLNAQPFGGEIWHLKASVGRAFRVPTFNDRFWQPGGNPDLRPEHGWSADTGIFLDGTGRQAEVTAFAHFMRDQIVWEPGGEDYWAPFNVRRTRALGLEASLRQQWRPSDRFQMEGSLFYTLTDARDRSDPEASTFNEPLRYVPREQLKAFASAEAGPFALDLSARYTGRRYTTSDGTRALDPYVVLNAQARVAQTIGGARLQLALQVENVLNADYAVLQNRPMPPRHARLRLVIETDSN